VLQLVMIIAVNQPEALSMPSSPKHSRAKSLAFVSAPLTITADFKAQYPLVVLSDNGVEAALGTLVA
jgi:hypothetical protein